MQKIVDAAMYAPQWLGIVEEYLMVPGLQKAGVWFHAHLNEYFTEEKNALVARYSSISPMDFKAGAFDSRWFREALSEVGEKLCPVVAVYAGGTCTSVLSCLRIV